MIVLQKTYQSPYDLGFTLEDNQSDLSSSLQLIGFLNKLYQNKAIPDSETNLNLNIGALVKLLQIKFTKPVLPPVNELPPDSTTYEKQSISGTPFYFSYKKLEPETESLIKFLIEKLIKTDNLTSIQFNSLDILIDIMSSLNDMAETMLDDQPSTDDESTTTDVKGNPFNKLLLKEQDPNSLKNYYYI